MKRGIIIVNAYSELRAARSQSARLKEEFEKLGVQVEILKNDGFDLRIEDGRIINGLDCGDFCVYLDKDKYVSEMLEKSGVRLFNRHGAIRACDDKMRTHIALADKGIPMPQTVAGLLCYDKNAPLKTESLLKIEKTLGYPLIIKACYGSLGADVFKADDRASFMEIAEKVKCKPHLFQKFISESAGRDIRAIVIGGEVKAAMLRKSESDFRSNIGLGGKGERIEIDEKTRDICGRTAKALCLDYCGIDLLLSKEGALVCEVNSNAFFDGIEGATGVNIARAYAGYICGQIY